MWSHFLAANRCPLRRKMLYDGGSVHLQSSSHVLSRTIGWSFATWLALIGPAAPDDISKYLDRPIRVVLGFSAGSPSDLASRTIGEKLTEIWKQPVITEYRPGAG